MPALQSRSRMRKRAYQLATILLHYRFRVELRVKLAVEVSIRSLLKYTSMGGRNMSWATYCICCRCFTEPG